MFVFKVDGCDIEQVCCFEMLRVPDFPKRIPSRTFGTESGLGWWDLGRYAGAIVCRVDINNVLYSPVLIRPDAYHDVDDVRCEV